MDIAQKSLDDDVIFVPDMIKSVNLTTEEFVKSPPIIERRMPKFNKLSKLISDLRDFETQLVNVAINQIDENVVACSSTGTGKQDLKTFNIDLEISFGSDDETRDISVKCQKITLTEVEQDMKDSEELSNVSVVSKNPLSCNDYDETLEDSDESDPAIFRCTFCREVFGTPAGLVYHTEDCLIINLKVKELIRNGSAISMNSLGGQHTDLNQAIQQLCKKGQSGNPS